MKGYLTLILALPALAAADQVVGGGGDNLRFLFRDGIGDAIGRISDLRRCSFASGTSDETKDWILANRIDLVTDIALSEHDWVTGPRDTCAFTAYSRNQPVTLSFGKCGNVMDKAGAGRLLVHESVHHFGIADHAFADAVATAVYSAQSRSTCPDPSEDPFDPLSCTGEPLQVDDALAYFDVAASTSRPFGETRLVSRQRFCHRLTGCSGWVTGPLRLAFANNEHWRGVFTYPEDYEAGALVFEVRDAATKKLSIQTVGGGSVEAHFPVNELPCYGGACWTLRNPRSFDFSCGSVGEAALRCTAPTASFDRTGSQMDSMEAELHWETQPYTGDWDFAGEKVSLEGVLRRNCLRLSAKSQAIRSKDSYVESELVVLGRF